MNNIIKNMPDYYFTSDFVLQETQAKQYELDQIDIKIQNLDKQFFFSTATEESLALYEAGLGLPVSPNKPVQERRELIISKFRGTGTFTEAFIKNVVKAYTNGDIEVIQNYADYSFIIKFISTIGIPMNINDVAYAIEEFKPAHLNFSFEFKYRTNGQLTGYTYNFLSGFTHDTIREGVI